jgi:hypothetical protein
MIPMTYEPLEGVLFVVAGLSLVERYIWGMIRLYLHGDEIPQMEVVTPPEEERH